MRLVIGLALAMVVSVGLNVWQFGASRAEAGREETRTELNDELARVRGAIQALHETALRNAEIADAARADHTVLLTDLTDIVDRSRQRITVYRDRIAAAPVLTCPPGIERMDAINRILEGSP